MISLPLKGTSNAEAELSSPLLGFTIVEASLLPLPCLLRGTSALKSFDEDDPLSLLATPSLHRASGSVAHNTFTWPKYPNLTKF